MTRYFSICLWLTIVLSSCSKEEKSEYLIGTWNQCLKDGSYHEFVIGEKLMLVFSYKLNGDEKSEVFAYNISLNADSIAYSGINVKTINNNQDTIIITRLSADKILINDYEEQYALHKIAVSIPPIDSINISSWTRTVLGNFQKRAEAKNCPDLRTEEEKKPPTMGFVEDNFEELIDIDKIPEWAEERLEKIQNNFVRSFDMIPSFLEGDYNGDGLEDIAVFIKDLKTNQNGFVILLKGIENELVAGAGISLQSGGSDYSWAELWETFENKKTHELTFLSNGDISGSQTVILDHDAILLKQSEGSQILIYYNGKSLVSYHQVD